MLIFVGTEILVAGSHMNSDNASGGKEPISNTEINTTDSSMTKMIKYCCSSRRDNSHANISIYPTCDSHHV